MRCQKCKALLPRTLRYPDPDDVRGVDEGPRAPFHDNFSELEAAARDGCRLCAVLFWNASPRDRIHTDADVWDRYSSLRASSQRLALYTTNHESGLNLCYLDDGEVGSEISTTYITSDERKYPYRPLRGMFV